jgi:hypothetical protein
VSPKKVVVAGRVASSEACDEEDEEGVGSGVEDGV